VRIKLDDEYEIDTDEHNFMLVHVKTIKDGKNAGQLRRDVVGYFGRLDYALERYALKAQFASKADGIDEVKALLTRIDETIAGVTR
jgi:hypothetical protein